MAKSVTVPALDVDRRIAEIRRVPLRLDARQALERRIVAALCAHMAAAGFRIADVFDGEETTAAADTKAAMEVIFNLDEAWLRFRKPDGPKHSVYLVLGNGEDIVSDWGYLPDDPDGFDAAMNAFVDDLPEYF